MLLAMRMRTRTRPYSKLDSGQHGRGRDTDASFAVLLPLLGRGESNDDELPSDYDDETGVGYCYTSRDLEETRRMLRELDENDSEEEAELRAMENDNDGWIKV